MSSTEAPTAAAPKAKTTTSRRGYVILELVADERPAGGDWHTVANLNATSADAAIRAHVGDNTKGGTFVAIPERSWRPRNIRVETVQKVTLA